MKTAGQIMAPEWEADREVGQLLTAEDTPILALADSMLQRRCTLAVVVRERQVVGTITVAQLIRSLRDHAVRP